MITELERRLHTMAQMAATLEAGDRAVSPPQFTTSSWLAEPIDYARRAMALFDAVDSLMAGPK